MIVEQGVVAELGPAAEILSPHVGSDFRTGSRVKTNVLATAGPGIRRTAEASETAHLRIGDHLGKGGADGCVEGVAAASQEFGANLSRQRLWCNYDASHTSDVTAPGATLSAVGAVTPRPSASVILVRDGPEGLETFMVRRHSRSLVAPSAYVFPGGTVRDDDLSLRVSDAAALARTLSSRSDSPVSAPEASSLYICAVRELFEEAGVFLVRDSGDTLLTVPASDTALQERLESTRLGLQAGDLTISSVLTDNSWQPAFDRLVPFSHWITPSRVAVRFDTRFFVAELPPGQSALHDTIETTAGLWLTPSRALEPDFHTVFATAHHLRRLSPFQTVAELLAFACEKAIRMVSPELAESREGLKAVIPPDVAESW